MLLYDLVGFEFHSQVLEFVWLTTWVCIKPGVNNGISYLSTGAGFLPSTVSLLRGSLFCFQFNKSVSKFAVSRCWHFPLKNGIYRNLHFDSPQKKHPCDTSTQLHRGIFSFLKFLTLKNWGPRSFGGSNHPPTSQLLEEVTRCKRCRLRKPQGIDLVVSQQVELSSAMIAWLGGGNSNIFGIFTPIPGEMIQFNEYVSDGLKPPTR